MVVMKACKECAEQISNYADKCPKCGHPNYSKGMALFSLIFVGASLYFFVFGGMFDYANLNLTRIEDQVASDSVTRYHIAKNEGDPMSTCVQAGMVAAAYLQASDSGNYNKWKAIERADCAAAGLPWM